MDLDKITDNLEDLSLGHGSEEKLEAGTGSSKTELSNDDKISDDEERFNTAEDISMQPNPPSASQKSDPLELQKAQFILRMAYIEVIQMALKENVLDLDAQAVGSVEGIIEMFHAPPPQGSRVECSTASEILPIPPQALISFLMNGEKWASTFSRIVSKGTTETKLGSLNMSEMEDMDVIVVNAEFRAPAPFLPKWRTCFVRYKKIITENMWAIVDVSSDYFKDATSNSTEIVEYKRRPSGVVIQENGVNCKAIWIENVEVQEVDLPRTIHPMSLKRNFCFSAEYWIGLLLHRLRRRRSQCIIEGELDTPEGARNIFTIAENVQRVFLETVNPFPNETELDIIQNERVRIFRDPIANHYTGSSTFYVPVAPITIFHFVNVNNMRLQWSGLGLMRNQKPIARIVTERGSNCITLHMKVDPEKASMEKGYFIQEASINDHCSFVVSSAMAGSDVQDSLLMGQHERRDFVKATGFAIMPAEAGGVRAPASLVTACIHGYLEEGEDGVNSMIAFLTSLMLWVLHCKTVSYRDAWHLERLARESRNQ